jgi:chloramphenicol-sensitive protein RarD
VLGHRIVWSALLSLILAFCVGKSKDIARIFADHRRLPGLIGSAVCISINWVFFIWAVGNGHALDASLGYFLYPLCNVLLGAVFLKEQLTGRQKAAVVLVALGVAVLTSGIGHVPWLVIVFPVTFSLYALLRKIVVVDALVGLAVETLLLTPFALLYLVTRPAGGSLLSEGPMIASLLVACGPVTAFPLVLFAYAARRLRLATLGLIQYLNPTLQLTIAVLCFGETFTRIHAVTFAFIWAGLLLYSVPPRPTTAR